LFREKTVTWVSGVALLLIGIALYPDFGVSWDEPSHLSRIWLNNVVHGTPLPEGTRPFYGPFFDSVALSVTEALSITDSRRELLLKHFLTFMFFFLSVLFFYRLCRRYFRNWVPSYVACILLVMHPTIFGHSFYNPKDLPFMSAFTIACFTLVWFLERMTIPRAVVHALTCAIAVDIRIAGVFLPCLTIFFVILELLYRPHRRNALFPNLKSCAVYLGALAGFIVLFWPLLWSCPLENFVKAFVAMSKYPWDSYHRYFGVYIAGTAAPWHYIPVWIAITTPISVIALFALGICDGPVHLWRVMARREEARPIALLPYVWFFVPVASVIVMHSVLYNGWRQMFFVYPAFVMIAVRGVLLVWNMSAQNAPRKALRLFGIAVLVLACIDLLGVAYFMVRNHPHHSLYFNAIVGGVNGGKDLFEGDRWGLSCRKLLECLLKRQTGREPILITSDSKPAKFNLMILPPEDRKRFKSIDGPSEALQGQTYYYLTTFRGFPAGWSTSLPKVCNVTVDGAEVAAAYLVPPGHPFPKPKNLFGICEADQ
jgi:hypothetical protein